MGLHNRLVSLFGSTTDINNNHNGNSAKKKFSKKKDYGSEMDLYAKTGVKVRKSCTIWNSMRSTHKKKGDKGQFYKKKFWIMHLVAEFCDF